MKKLVNRSERKNTQRKRFFPFTCVHLWIPEGWITVDWGNTEKPKQTLRERKKQ